MAERRWKDPSQTEQRKNTEKARSDAAKGIAPDFQLAGLTKFPNKALISDPSDDDERSALKRVTLTLALIYNDMKDLIWARSCLEYFEPTNKTAIEPYAGQYLGMRAFFARHHCGVVAELGKVINAKREVFKLKVFDDAKALLKKTPKAFDAWETMLDEFARDPDEKVTGRKKPRHRSKYARCVAVVRDKAAYHYGFEGKEDTLLSESYAKHCSMPGDDRHKSAYVSLGANTEGSRFYFADAAVISLAQGYLDAEGVKFDGLYDFLFQAQFALRAIVEALMKYLSATAREPADRARPAAHKVGY